MTWLNIVYNLQNICWSAVPLSEVTWETSGVTALSCFQCHTDLRPGCHLPVGSSCWLGIKSLCCPPISGCFCWVEPFSRMFSGELFCSKLQETKTGIFWVLSFLWSPIWAKRSGSNLAHSPLYLCVSSNNRKRKITCVCWDRPELLAMFDLSVFYRVFFSCLRAEFGYILTKIQ